MAIWVDDVMKLLIHLAQGTQLEVTLRNCYRGAMVAGASAFVGGLLGGPFGIAVGGAVGGIIGWITSEDFKSVPQILAELPAAERQKLCDETIAVFKNLKWSDARQLIDHVNKNPPLKEQVLKILTNYFIHKVNAKIKFAE